VVVSSVLILSVIPQAAAVVTSEALIVGIVPESPEWLVYDALVAESAGQQDVYQSLGLRVRNTTPRAKKKLEVEVRLWKEGVIVPSAKLEKPQRKL
jgi:hypothetical protein